MAATVEDINKAKEQIKKEAISEGVKHAIEVTDVANRDRYHHRLIVGLFVVILVLVGFGIWNHVVNYTKPATCPSGERWVLVQPDTHHTWRVCELNQVPAKPR